MKTILFSFIIIYQIILSKGSNIIKQTTDKFFDNSNSNILLNIEFNKINSYDNKENKTIYHIYSASDLSLITIEQQKGDNLGIFSFNNSYKISNYTLTLDYINNSSLNFIFNETESNESYNFTLKNNSYIKYNKVNKQLLFQTGNSTVLNIFFTDKISSNSAYYDYSINFNNTNTSEYFRAVVVKDKFNITDFQLITTDFLMHYKFLAYIIFLSGVFITLYGAYHYRITFLINIVFLIYGFFSELTTVWQFVEERNIVVFFAITAFIIGVALFIIITPNKANKRKYFCYKAFFGAFIGALLYKTISHYFFISNRVIKYYLTDIILLILFIGIFVFLNSILQYEEISYILCAIISGPYYIVYGIELVLGGFFCDQVLLQPGVNFKFNDKQSFYMYMVIHFLLILYSSIQQYFHRKAKNSEMQDDKGYTLEEGEKYIGDVTYDPQRISNHSEEDDRISDINSKKSSANTERNKEQNNLDPINKNDEEYKEDDYENDNNFNTELNDQED